MEKFLADIEAHWRAIGLSICSILWVGKLQWRVAKLENEKAEEKAKRTPLVKASECKEDRQACSAQISKELKHLTEQVDFLIQHLIKN